MALGAITQVPIDPHSATQAIPIAIGDVKMTVTNLVGDSSYPTGGSAITPQQLGLSTVLAAQTEILASSGSNNTANSSALIITNGGSTLNLKCFSSADSAGNPTSETANTTNLSGLTWQVIAFGF